jgi:hypothetical protein
MVRKATESNTIQKARARLPIIVNFFGNSMVSLILSLPVRPYSLKQDKFPSTTLKRKKNYSFGLLWWLSGTKTAAATVVVHKPFLSPAAD